MTTPIAYVTPLNILHILCAPKSFRAGTTQYCKLAAANRFMLDRIRESVSKVGSVYDAYFLSSYLFVVDGRPPV